MSFDLTDFKNSKYSEIELEALQEISNIGVGHSATALSQLLHRKVDMSIPYVKLIHIQELAKDVAGADDAIVAGVLVDCLDEDIRLNFLIIFNKDSIKSLLKIFQTSEPPDDLAELDDLSLSIIKEVGNILLLHVISAINSFTDSKWYPTPPQLVVDMAGAIISEVLGRDQIFPDNFLKVQCDVFTENSTVLGEIFILPNETGINRLMDRLYGEGWRAEI